MQVQKWISAGVVLGVVGWAISITTVVPGQPPELQPSRLAGGVDNAQSGGLPGSSGTAPRSRSATPAGMPGMPGMSGGMMPGMSGGGMPGMVMGGSGLSMVSVDDQLEGRANQLLAAYAQTEDPEARGKLRDEVASLLAQVFDLRQTRRMQELAALEQRVRKFRSTLEARENLKSDILKNRLDYLVREADGLGWDDGATTNQSLPGPAFGAAGSGFGSGAGLSGGAGAAGSAMGSGARRGLTRSNEGPR